MTKIKSKDKKKIFYDKKSDALWFVLESGVEVDSREIAPGVTAEIGEKGNIIGIEILDASKVIIPLFENKSSAKI